MRVSLINAEDQSIKQVCTCLSCAQPDDVFIVHGLHPADLKEVRGFSQTAAPLEVQPFHGLVEVKKGTLYLIPHDVNFIFDGTSIQDVTEKDKKVPDQQESEAQIRYLVEKSRELICSHEPDGTYRYVSPSSFTLLGYAPEELLGNSPYDYIHPDDIDRLKGNYHGPLLQGKAQKNVQYRFRRKDGGYIWLDTYNEILFDDQGKVQSLLSGSRDITELKEAEIRLSESDERFRGIADNIPGVVYLCHNDATYSMVYLNQEVENLTGYRIEDFTDGRISFVDLYHPDDKEIIFSTVDEALENQKSFHLSYRIKKKGSDTWVWVDEYGQGVYERGELKLIEGVILDSTERKITEVKLREREANLKAIIESTNSIIGLFDTRKHLIEFNQAFKDYVWKVDKIKLYRGMDLISMLDKKWVKTFSEYQDRALAGEKFRDTIEYPTPQGILHLMVSYNPISHDNRIIGISVFVEDITELRESQKALENYAQNLERLVQERTRELELKNKELEKGNEELEEAIRNVKSTQAQLIHAEKMASLGVLAAGIGHEINNPLNFIQNGCNGLAQELKHSEVDTTVLQSYFGIINDGVRRASDIVKSLGHFSRQVKSMKERCVIHEIIDNCLIILNARLKDRVAVAKKYVKEELVIMGNDGKLHQVFLNILSNAEQAIKGEGIIEIKTGRRRGKVYVEFTDNGEGIPLENLNKISDPFFTTKEPGEGTGLGLFIAYSTVRELNGSIEVTSKVKKGTTFTLEFPEL